MSSNGGLQHIYGVDDSTFLNFDSPVAGDC